MREQVTEQVTEQMGPTQPASSDVVVRDGCVHWHSRSSCDERDSREGAVAYRVSLRDAWASCLVPCPVCAGDDIGFAAGRWGSLTPVERARLTLPVLQDLVTGVTTVPPSAHRAGASRLPPLPPAPQERPAPVRRPRVSARVN